MRDFDKEYSDWKKDIYTVLIMGFVLGLIAGILIQSGGGMVDAWLSNEECVATQPKSEYRTIRYHKVEDNIQVRILS